MIRSQPKLFWLGDYTVMDLVKPVSMTLQLLLDQSCQNTSIIHITVKLVTIGLPSVSLTLLKLSTQVDPFTLTFQPTLLIPHNRLQLNPRFSCLHSKSTFNINYSRPQHPRLSSILLIIQFYIVLDLTSRLQVQMIQRLVSDLNN